MQPPPSSAVNRGRLFPLHIENFLPVIADSFYIHHTGIGIYVVPADRNYGSIWTADVNKIAIHLCAASLAVGILDGLWDAGSACANIWNSHTPYKGQEKHAYFNRNAQAAEDHHHLLLLFCFLFLCFLISFAFCFSYFFAFA